MTDLSSAGLIRFVQAQTPVYTEVVLELANGRKTSHWMWFFFPQLRGLAHSARSRFYGIAGSVEANGYWNHPVLRQRLVHCTGLVLATQGRTAHQIFGSPDDLKLQSCMTLFSAVAPDEPPFQELLARFYAGARDPATLSLLR